MSKLSHFEVPRAVYEASRTITEFAAEHDETDGWSVYGLMPTSGHSKAIAARDARIAELEADRRVLQSPGEHPAPCARHCEANAFRIELRNKDARIAELDKRVAELERKLSESRSANGRWARGMDYVGALEIRIAELEKQAAIDKTLLALADARINRELRDDFAGRAMAALIPMGAYDVEKLATVSWGVADEMLKAKGGA